MAFNLRSEMKCFSQIICQEYKWIKREKYLYLINIILNSKLIIFFYFKYTVLINFKDKIYFRRI